MRILADENLDRPVVAWLREQGHDVLAMAEVDPGRSDPSVLTLASAESRVLITNDLDYGGFVFRRGQGTRGLVLLHLRAESPQVLLSRFQQHWPIIEREAPGHFLVVKNRRVRIRPLPA